MPGPVANLRAKFARVSGSLELDAGDPFHSTFRVEIGAAGHPRQEEFMRSEPWLDTEHYPLITFDGKEIEPRRRGYTIKGELTLNGVTRRIEIPFDFRGVVSDPWGLRGWFHLAVHRRPA